MPTTLPERSKVMSEPEHQSHDADDNDEDEDDADETVRYIVTYA